jgi:hypothetical protein
VWAASIAVGAPLESVLGARYIDEHMFDVQGSLATSGRTEQGADGWI